MIVDTDLGLGPWRTGEHTRYEACGRHAGALARMDFDQAAEHAAACPACRVQHRRTDVGRRVRAVHFGPSRVVDDNETVPPGTEGVVDYVDDTGTRHVKWDNGARLGLVPEHDTFEWI